ncbi:MAG: DEAD/DEAH box helicase family protein [Chloroflexi bacterium]|nr:DEAD/DEAH box helicase family protein [Chloroflexota bacterium]
MAAVIENPVINSPFVEPTVHFRFAEDGITNEIVEGRRISSYFVPIPPPKKRGPQLALPGDWVAERIQPNDLINRIRERVALWRKGNYPGITPVTRRLLEHWNATERERRLFFCQIEALETAIYLAEVAPRHGDAWVENQLREANESKNPGLYRIAFKMATGSGKTFVMAMIIAWYALNKFANTQDPRFSDSFLVVTPGITIRERLRVLLPNAEGNYYEAMDLVPMDELARLQHARVEITNYHAFLRQEKLEAASLTKKVLAGRDGDPERFKETADEMVRRVCRSFGSKRNVVILNDEAHHCYRERPEPQEEKLSTEERAQARADREAARVWLSGLEAVKAKIGVRGIYDLSATPFFLRGSGYPEGTLFPWVVSDFSLIDAIESGIVKVPRVPVSDDQLKGTSPTFRDLWPRIRDELPKRSRVVDEDTGQPLPKELEAALIALYGHYERGFRAWETAASGTPPVFIVVCANTAVSKRVFDWIAGREKLLPNGAPTPIPGNLALFSNVADGKWRDRPVSFLIDSTQIESGEAMDDAFKRIAAREIEEFKETARRAGRDPDEITDEDLLREVMNTVGKRGKLGENVRCVVSVSMLSEGWDASTVTHILGVRAFGTQLLCEQVIGRGLRRRSYDADENGMFEAEYADVFGVPFSFIPIAGGAPVPRPLKEIRRVRALPERASLEIAFPRVVGYRYDVPAERISAKFGPESTMTLSNEDIPYRTQSRPIVGEETEMTLEQLKGMRLQTLAYRIARLTVDQRLRAGDGSERPWLFPQVLEIVKKWFAECVFLKDGAFPQLIAITQYAHAASERIERSIIDGTSGEARILPRLRDYDPRGSTATIDFNTTKGVWDADPTKSHLNYVVIDNDWEAKLAQTVESMPEVLSYVKNQGLGLQIPYTFEGTPANYLPDYVVRVNDGRGEPLNVLLEVTGERKKQKAEKVATAKTKWVPAVNALGAYGRWAFIEVTDPWDAGNLIRSTFLSGRTDA